MTLAREQFTSVYQNRFVPMGVREALWHSGPDLIIALISHLSSWLSLPPTSPFFLFLFVKVQLDCKHLAEESSICNYFV